MCPPWRNVSTQWFSKDLRSIEYLSNKILLGVHIFRKFEGDLYLVFKHDSDTIKPLLS